MTASRVSDYQPQDPAILEKLRLQERYRQVKLSIEKTPAFQCSPEFIKKLSNVLYDMGQDYFNYDNQTNEMKIFRYVDGHLRTRLLAGIDDNIEFANYIHSINELTKEAYEKQIQDTQARVQADKNYRSLIEKAEKKLRNHFSEVREEKRQIEAQKAQLARVYSDAEKQVGVHMQTWSVDDLERSKKIAKDKKDEIKKQIKQLDLKVLAIDEQIKPFSIKVESCNAKLETDLDESTFKEVRLAKEYAELQIDNLRRKMMPFFDETHALHQKIAKIYKQLPMLNCLISKEALLKNALTNFPRRQERLLQRINKFIRERNEIENLRESLNSRWQQLTADNQELVPVLPLRSDSQIYFI